MVYISLFLFGSLQNTLPYDRQRNMDINILCCHQLTLSMFNELYSCCLQQWDLAVCFSWANYCIINSLGFLWISMLPFQPTIQLGGTLSPNWKLYLMTRFGQYMLQVPSSLGACLESLWYIIRSFHCNTLYISCCQMWSW